MEPDKSNSKEEENLRKIENERRSKIPKTKLIEIEYFRDNKNRIKHTINQFNQNGYKENDIIKSYTLKWSQYDKFISLYVNYTTGSNHFNESLCVNNFIESYISEGDYELRPVLFHPITSKKYSISLNYERSELVKAIELSLAVEKSSQKLNEPNYVNLIKLLTDYWLLILIIGLAFCGLIVENSY